MYHIVFILLLIFSIKEFVSCAISQTVFRLMYLLLTLMAVFRFGQGTDYFNYYEIYDLGLIISLKDPGYWVLNYLCAKIEIPFYVFVSCFAFVTMALFYLFLSKICKKSAFALFLFYVFFYFVLVLSAIRQGLVLAFVSSVLYPLLIQRYYLKFYVLLLFISTFHLSVLVLAIFPVFMNNKCISLKIFQVLFILCSILLFFNIDFLSFFTFGRFVGYLNGSDGGSVFPRIFRIILFFPILVLIKDKFVSDFYYKIAFVGFFVYCLFSSSDLAAARLEVYFRLSIIPIMFSLSLLSEKSIKQPMFTYYLILSSFYWFKCISTSIDEGGYINCNAFTYPYVSLFDADKIINYRTILTS